MGASLGDLFYPGNSEHRHKVVQLTQKLYDYMKANFRATNVLSEFMNAYVAEAPFLPISVDGNQTIKYNSDVLCQRIKEIQEIVEKIDKKLSEDLDPNLYRQLMKLDLPYEDRVETASNVVYIAGTASTATAVAVCVALASKEILRPVVAVLEVVATTAIANVWVGTLGRLAFDAIFQAITGSTEQEESIEHLESACENLIPASERYMHRRRNQGGPRGTCPPLVRICFLVAPLQTVWYGDLF